MKESRNLEKRVKTNSACFPDIEKLKNGERANEQQILDILEFINNRPDCADFRMICILRSLYDFSNLISEETLKEMKCCVLSFKYWMDEPGEDSMCYWSENHQLIFAVCEYLAGQLYPDEIFKNNGMTGIKHREKAAVRLEQWLERRFIYGFSEFHSNTYYEEDVAPLSLLIDCCEDKKMVTQACIMLDLILLDMALLSFNGAFCAASGRCYAAQKQDPSKQDVLEIIQKAFKIDRLSAYRYDRISTDFILNRNYKVPEVLKKIAQDKSPWLVQDSMGLSLAEVKKEFGKNRTLSDYGAYLWAMEAFTNVQSIKDTIKMFKLYKLETNEFLKDLKILNSKVLSGLNLLPLVIRLLNPVTQGVAIQRANTLTLKTKDFMLSTAQLYYPQEFGDQQHIWQASLPSDISVFTTHPGAAAFDDKKRNFSPGEWVGNGIQPFSAQYNNISLSLYDLRVCKGFMEPKRAQYTHAFVPFDKFDEINFTENLKVFCGRKGESYIALFSTQPMAYGKENELVQNGRVTAWACMVGSAETHSTYEKFYKLAKKVIFTQESKTLKLHIRGKEPLKKYSNYIAFNNCLEIKPKKGFFVDGIKQELSYQRIKAPCCNVKRKPKEINIRWENVNLYLNYKFNIRKEWHDDGKVQRRLSSCGTESQSTL